VVVWKLDVDRVQLGAHQRDRKIGLIVPVMVPGEGPDTIAGLDAQFREARRQLGHTPPYISVRVPVNSIVGARNDLRIWKQFGCPLEERADRKLRTHNTFMNCMNEKDSVGPLTSSND